MGKIKFGIIGIGNMGCMRIRNLHCRIPQSEVIAVCGRREAQVKAVQEEFGIPYGYTDYDEMLQNPEIDAVLIATGADAHKDQVVAACKAKKHIFCEKPLAKR